MLEEEGSVRVDLVGGTLDLSPINLVLDNVVTINLATSLKAKVKLSKIKDDGIKFISKDYQSEKYFKKTDFTKENLKSDFFGPLSFLAQILDYFEIHFGLLIELESGSPPGAGLGGSSAMGVTFYKALCRLKDKPFSKEMAIKVVNQIEARILDSGPAGYQDYYPALYGGILALKPTEQGIVVEQLYEKELAKNLESKLTLIYSGDTRHSGINNWEVYKGFFDKKEQMRNGLTEISKVSNHFYNSLKNKNKDYLQMISKEGEVRSSLFSGLVSPSMNELFKNLKKSLPHLGLKVCGAGGGGCFLLVHDKGDKELINSEVLKTGKMKVLDFKIGPPLEYEN